MGIPFTLEKLSKSTHQRTMLYKAAGPIFTKRYGKKDGPTAFEHAKVVTEKVARYTQRSRDMHWAGMCVLLASLHSLDNKIDGLPNSVLRHMSRDDTADLTRSFLNFNILRDQDEADTCAKNPSIYSALLKPTYSRGGFLVLPPEVFVRVVDMSEEQFFTGKDAKRLHKVTSHGHFPKIIRNMAHSMLQYWRPASVQLLLFSCYDKQSNIIAKYLYNRPFRKMQELYGSLKNEFKQVAREFSQYLSQIVVCAEQKGIPIVRKTDRETGAAVPFILREKTPGSTTIKAIGRGMISPDGSDFDKIKIVAGIHDFIASTLVAEECHHAHALYDMIISRGNGAILEEEPLFYPGCGNGNKSRNCHYSGVGHIDFDAAAFGATVMKRVESHIRSCKSDRDYIHHRQAGRGFRDSQPLADAWGDHNFEIVEALGLQH